MIAYLPLLYNKRVGLVVNQTSMIGNTHLVDTLLTLEVKIEKIFAPEHGFRGQADAGALISNERDAKTGIQIMSLYGQRKKATPEDLADIDILVFDIQDVGVRFYTYINTLQYVMEAAADAGIMVVVLDRPNPNGHYIDGPILDTTYRSFVGLNPVPVVYGMTIGEYAQMVNGEGWIPKRCDLLVIPCKYYDHNTKYDLPVRPSPNLPNLRAVLLYPGICFFEGTPFSLGRGTNAPFQVVGDPSYPEKRFSFTPQGRPGAMDPPLKGVVCYGMDLTAQDLDSLFDQRKMDLSVLLHFYAVMDKSIFFNSKWFDTLAGGPAFREAIQKGWNEEQIRESWKAGLAAFNEKRKKYLLYSDFDIE